MPNELDRVRHASGAILWDGGSASGWTQLAETIACVHCGAHIEIKVGSGRERGYCPGCRGLVCGHPNCWECVPEELMLQRLEAKGAQDWAAATNDAERVAELLTMKNPEVFLTMVDALYAKRQQNIEYRERMDANLRVLRGA